MLDSGRGLSRPSPTSPQPGCPQHIRYHGRGTTNAKRDAFRTEGSKYSVLSARYAVPQAQNAGDTRWTFRSLRRQRRNSTLTSLSAYKNRTFNRDELATFNY